MCQTQVIIWYLMCSQPYSAPFPWFCVGSFNLESGNSDEWMKAHCNLRSADSHGFSATQELPSGLGQQRHPVRLSTGRLRRVAWWLRSGSQGRSPGSREERLMWRHGPQNSDSVLGWHLPVFVPECKWTVCWWQISSTCC